MAGYVVSTKLTASVEGFTAGMRKAKASVDDLTKATTPKKGDAFDKLSDKAAIAGVGIAGAMGLAVKRFADFDQSMSAVKANSGATSIELEKLRGLAVKLGADSQFSAKEAADGINEMAKAGVAVQDVMGGGLKGALDLAAAGQIGVAEAAETAATAMTQFKLQGDAVPHIADLLANAANKAQGGVGDMAQALKQAGLVAASTGLSIEETTAGLTAFASAGLIGSDAGTSFKTMLQRLSAPSDEAKAAMDDIGLSAYDAQGNFVGLANVAGQLQAGMENLTPAQRNATMATIFGSDAVRAANVLYDEGADGINNWTDAVNEQGAAAKQAATLTDNLKGDLERLGGALDSVFIQTGSGANDGLRVLVQGVTGLVDTVGKVPGPLLLAGGALASFALLAPRGVKSFREYRAQLDSLGLSMEKIAARGPRAAKGVDVATKAAKGLAVAAAAATVTYAAFGDEITDLGPNSLARDLDDGAQALDRINKRLAESSAMAGRMDSGVTDFGSALKGAFDPSVMEQVDKGIGSLKGFFGGSDVSNIALAKQRLSELDSALAGMVSAGNAEQATAAFNALGREAARQGISVDELKKKFPQYAEAVAGAADAADSSGSSQRGLSDNLQKVQDSAEEARDAVDKYIQSMQDAGLVVLDVRSANREFEQSLDDVTERLNKRKELEKELKEAQATSADTDKSGKVDKDEAKRKAEDVAKLKAELDNYSKGFDTNTQAGRDNQAALDKVAESALDLAKAQYDAKVSVGDLEGAEAAYRGSLVKSREALIKTATQMGLSKTEAEKYADQILKIPPAKSTKVTITVAGAGALKEAGDYLKGLQDKNVKLTVGTVKVGNERVNAGQFYSGGYTGDGGKYEPAGVVHRGEYVINKASTSAIGKATLEYLNRHGRLPGYSSGGFVESARAARPVPMMLAPSASRSAATDGLGRQFVTGSLDLGNGLHGFVRAVVDDAINGRKRMDALGAM